MFKKAAKLDGGHNEKKFSQSEIKQFGLEKENMFMLEDGIE